jgi:outer membrane protein with beta-barrel domain
MKRIHWSLAALVMLFGIATLVAPAAAQNMLGTLEVTGGYAKSSTDVNSVAIDSPSGGVTLGAGYFHRLGAPSTQWGVEAAYDNLGSLDWNTGTATATTSMSVFRVTPEFRMSFGPPVGPSFFAQAGMGLYAMSAKTESSDLLFNGDASTSKFGYNVGAGVGFPVGPKTRMNFQGNYHSVSTEGQSTNYVNIRAGVAFGL